MSVMCIGTGPLIFLERQTTPLLNIKKTQLDAATIQVFYAGDKVIQFKCSLTLKSACLLPHLVPRKPFCDLHKRQPTPITHIKHRLLAQSNASPIITRREK